MKSGPLKSLNIEARKQDLDEPMRKHSTKNELTLLEEETLHKNLQATKTPPIYRRNSKSEWKTVQNKLPPNHLKSKLNLD